MTHFDCVQLSSPRTSPTHRATDCMTALNRNTNALVLCYWPRFTCHAQSFGRRSWPGQSLARLRIPTSRSPRAGTKSTPAISVISTYFSRFDERLPPLPLIRHVCCSLLNMWLGELGVLAGGIPPSSTGSNCVTSEPVSTPSGRLPLAVGMNVVHTSLVFLTWWALESLTRLRSEWRPDRKGQDISRLPTTATVLSHRRASWDILLALQEGNANPGSFLQTRKPGFDSFQASSMHCCKVKLKQIQIMKTTVMSLGSILIRRCRKI